MKNARKKYAPCVVKKRIEQNTRSLRCEGRRIWAKKEFTQGEKFKVKLFVNVLLRDWAPAARLDAKSETSRNKIFH